MSERDIEGGLARRLPWLLVFRGVVATGLLALTIVADASDWPVARLSGVLYGVVIGTYFVVFLLGLLLRSGVSPIVVAATHLVTAVVAALAVVQVTGGVGSAFSFLYLLVILDGAIVGSRRVALAVASVASIAYGTQVVLQLYGVLEANLVPTPSSLDFINAVVTHMAAFYLTALLSGHLSSQLESARAAATTARTDLHHAEVFHGAVLESLPVGVMSIDVDGRVQSANAAAARILGTSVAQLVGQALPVAFQLFSVSGANEAELLVEVNGGSRQLWLGRSVVAYDERAGLERARPVTALVFEDRTEVRALAESLRVKERLASIGQMAAAIAHELRNPLAAISGSVELMRDGSAPERRKLEAIVLREIQRLNSLVGDFLIYARPSPPTFSRVDLVTVTRDLVTVLQTDGGWAENPIRVVADGGLEAEADTGQIQQVLWNLLLNAKEASPPGATIEVRLGTRAEADNRRLTLVVVDRGSGLSVDARAHLFEPFWTSKSQGTGLGLAVVQRIVDAHGGQIVLRPAPGGGTEAEVLLPDRCGIASVGSRLKSGVGEG